MATIKTILPPEQARTLLRIAPYCRVSSGSDDQQHSFAAQMQYYTELVQKHPDWELVDIYADEGITGTSTERREEFQRLMQDCARGKIDRIITKSVSRFARNTVDCLSAVRQLSAMGVSVLFEKEQIDTAKMSSEIMLALTGTQAQDESFAISTNMRWSYEKRMRSGEFNGCYTPYGYRFQDRKLTIYEPEAVVVQQIFEMYLSGYGISRITRCLKEREVPHRYGEKEWNYDTVDYILRNERYMGDALLQKTYTTNTLPARQKENRGQKTKYYIENSHPAIITREQFQTVAALLKTRVSPSQTTDPHSLSGLIRCGECGHPFRRRCDATTAYWKCARRDKGSTTCTPIRVDEDDVITALIRLVNLLREHSGQIIAPTVAALETAQSRANGTQHKVYEIDKEIASLKRQDHGLTQLQNMGILDASDFAAQHNELANRVSKLRIQRSKLLNLDKGDDTLNQLRTLADTIGGMEVPMVQFDEPLIRSVVEKVVVVSPTKIEICLQGGLTFTEHLPEKKRRYSRKEGIA